MTIDRKLQRRDWEVSYARDEPAYDYYYYFTESGPCLIALSEAKPGS
jgi:hypothetical protein